MLFGAHVSIAGGIEKAPERAAAFGCEVFQIFSRPPQGGNPQKITKESAGRLRENMVAHGQKEFYIHTPYIINLASAEKRIAEGSVRIIKEELERGSALGAKYVMTHLGSAKDHAGDGDAAKKMVVENLKRIVDGAYKTELLIEIAAGSGNVIGSTFEELAYFLDHLKGYTVGICLDTAHMFAAGYDIRTSAAVKKTFDLFDQIVGLKHLRMFHLNDSKVDIGEKKDRHEHLGDGKIGLGGFEALAKEKRLREYNFALETEHDKVAEDIAIMKELREKYAQ
ncbi:deoxyribonuclease IV [Candidatus Azambacteria bacterium]|nr:deoxyribonuclease IV [Candidatus Azambacteria bacterium]MBI3685117.1 deoxyribonuclease IV [Candidatus Azambacteria bacterium]